MPDDREQVIRERAYQIWKQQGCPAGHSLDHGQADAQIANEEALGIRHEKTGATAAPRPLSDQDVVVFFDAGEAAESCFSDCS